MANILHIDQDETAQQAIQLAFGEIHNVISAIDGPTAIQYCTMIQPDIILMSLALPDIDGYELASRLKMFMPQTPILLMVEADFHQTATPPLPADFGGVLTKPLDIKELQSYIHAMVPPSMDLQAELASIEDQKTRQQLGQQIIALNRANNRLASLNTISALIGTSLDLEHLTDEILAQINKTVAFDSATLFLLKGDILEAAASRGLLGYRRGMNTYSKNEQNSAWRAVNHKLPLIIGDVQESEYWEARPELDQIKSWLGVPLIYKDRVVGVLTLDKNEPQAFTDADARYIFTLAYQVAIAVENAQLFEEWEEQATRLKLINEVSKEISTLLDSDDLLKTLGQTLFEKLNYDRVAIFGVDDTQSTLILKAIYGHDSAKLAVDGYRLPITADILGEAINQRATIVINDVSQHRLGSQIEESAIQSRLINPIYIENQVEALIDVGRLEVNGFSDQDLWTLSSLSSQATTILENARLYRAVQTYSSRLERTVLARTQRLQAIKKMSQLVSQGLNLAELLLVVGRGISQIFSEAESHSAQVTIGLLHGSMLTLNIYETTLQKKFKAPSGEGQDYMRKMSVTMIEDQAPIGRVIAQAKPMILNNFNLDGDGLPTFSDQTNTMANSLMVVPLITGGKVIGLIMVKQDLKTVFDDSDLETLESLAFQVASAIEHTRLLQKTKEIAIADERTRLAREMHDGVAQNLAYLMLQVDRCLNMVEEGGTLDDLLEKISSLLAQNIDELRRNIFDLRPVELEGRPLFNVLQNFVTEFGERWGVKTDYFVKDYDARRLAEVDISPEVESSLYRILQETLSNARQHAKSTQLAVTLAVEDDRWITLQVQDNGQGFDMEKINLTSAEVKNKGLGLVSMRERAERIGGSLTMKSNLDEGTYVLAKLPLI